MTERAPSRPPVVGIVGGVACGKSTVAGLLAKRGARVTDADRIGHAVLESADVRRQLADAFGDGILDSDGRVSRPLLAEAVFGRPERVVRLNQITHPSIIRQVQEQVQEFTSDPNCPLAVVDAALLLETDLNKGLCDALLYIDVPRELRLRRARERGMSEEQFEKREQAQLDPENKREQADFIIHNIGTPDDLHRQIAELWPSLVRHGALDSGSSNV